MTDLKQKLGAKWINMTGHSGLPEEYDDFVSLLITILMQQREALEKITHAKGSFDKTACIVQLEACKRLAIITLAATGEALKKIGVEI